ncbi:MAG: ATP-binding protein [Provencibacterium sp.]|jgi:predicted kinase|nr:ATP-binding protein [Provencibacterium sp.]
MYAILIAGAPACGKTTLARRLSGELRIPAVSKDDIKELLFDAAGFRSREEKVALGRGSEQILYYFAGRLLDAGQPVILENNFESSSQEGLSRLFAPRGCRTLTLLLQAPADALYARYLQREKSPERHPGHIHNTSYPPPAGAPAPSPLTREQFLSGIARRGMADFHFGQTLTVDATFPERIDIPALAAAIRSWAEG